MKIRTCIVLLSIFTTVSLKCRSTQLHDLSKNWRFYSSNKTVSGKAIIPSDLYLDLERNGFISKPLNDNNYLNFKWISNDNWTYLTNFDVDGDDLKNKAAILALDGLDTVATVYLNGQKILFANNQFRQHRLHISRVLRHKNELKIVFESPVKYARRKAHDYYHAVSHKMPPVCPPEITDGECHINFIRKAQYSFSWDWGPSFPTMGIWKPIRLLLVDQYIVDDFSWTTVKHGDNWLIQGKVTFLKEPQPMAVSFDVSIAELGIYQQFNEEVADSNTSVELYFEVHVPAESVELWWPNGYGGQKLYTIVVTSQCKKVKKSIGFREIKLVEDFVDPKNTTKGRNFYFTVNGVQVFLKGTNWIPTSMFVAENDIDRMHFLLDSAAEVGFNVMRICGIGIYESEEFYEYTSRKGIMIWQDLMFACALYPTDSEFLENISREIREQITRIMKHASVLLYSANNENEIAIRQKWYSTANYDVDRQIDDYRKFYVATVQPTVLALDNSRPFILSSPGNGIVSQIQGGVALNPGDERYGDIHFYNEQLNLWDDASYLIPRCATEYGVQSYPFSSTMLHWINASEWFYTSKTISKRQHHVGGFLNNLRMVFRHFPMPSQCLREISSPKELACYSALKNSSDFMDRFVYFSQVYQALVLKRQTEHYRRFRKILLPDGRGNTQCAMYWQLNDVWAAPSWSSIDFDLQWKIAHYEARKFMASTAAVLYSPSDRVQITIVNDLPIALNRSTVILEQIPWSNKFEPIYQWSTVLDVPAATAIEVDMSSANQNQLRLQPASGYLLRVRVLSPNKTELLPETVLFPDKLYEIDFNDFGDPRIESVKKVNDTTYSISLISQSISPFTWITIRRSVLGWFSDNGFTMTSERKIVTLHLRNATDLTIEDFAVCNLKTCAAL